MLIRVIFDKETRRKPQVVAAARLWRKKADGALECRVGLGESEDGLLRTAAFCGARRLDRGTRNADQSNRGSVQTQEWVGVRGAHRVVTDALWR